MFLAFLLPWGPGGPGLCGLQEGVPSQGRGHAARVLPQACVSGCGGARAPELERKGRKLSGRGEPQAAWPADVLPGAGLEQGWGARCAGTEEAPPGDLCTPAGSWARGGHSAGSSHPSAAPDSAQRPEASSGRALRGRSRARAGPGAAAASAQDGAPALLGLASPVRAHPEPGGCPGVAGPHMPPGSPPRHAQKLDLPPSLCPPPPGPRPRGEPHAGTDFTAAASERRGRSKG